MRIRFLSMLPSLLLYPLFASAQKRTIDTQRSSTSTTITSETIESIPFARGKNEFSIMRNIDFASLKLKGTSERTNELSLNVDYNRFVADHFGIGIEFDGAFTGNQDVTTSKTRDWMTYGNVIYGTTLKNDFNIYGKFSAGIGQDKFIYSSTTNKNDLFGLKFEIGSPIRTFGDGNAYIAPYLGFNYLHEKISGGKTTDNTFRFGFRFENYSLCSDYSCDLHLGGSLSRNAYDQGRSFIGYNTMGDFGFGSSKFSGTNTSKTDNSGGSLDLNYGYYLIPDLAIGASFGWNGQTQKSAGTKFTSSQILFTPMITANLPVKNYWNNLFIEGGLGFGYQKSGTGSSPAKDNIMSYCMNLGFNSFFSRHLAFTPKIGYEWETFKNTTTDAKDKWNGFEFGLGASMHF